MMEQLMATERAKYRRVWGMPEYRVASHGLSMWQKHRDWFPEFDTAVDIGCGLGRLFCEWNDDGIEAWGVDLVREALDPWVAQVWGHRFVEQAIHDVDSIHVQFGICTDVMEHIPPQLVDVTLASIARMCRDEVLFKVAHGRANDLGGLPLHLTLESASWWTRRMNATSGRAVVLGTVNRSGFIDTAIRWRPHEVAA